MAIIMISFPLCLSFMLMRNRNRRSYKAWDRSRRMQSR